MAQEDKTPRQVGLKRDGTPQKRANQWTKAKEVQGKVNERDRDRLRAEMLAHRLEQHVEGKVELSATQVQAAKILIDKGKPSLQAVEQTVFEEPKTETEIMAQLHTLLANPGTRAQIEAMLRGAPTLVAEQKSVVTEQQKAAQGS